MARRRLDGRSACHLRALAVDFGVVPSCDGSARLSTGDTHVLVGIQGPRPPRGVRNESSDGAILEILVSPCCGYTGAREKELEALVRDVFSSVIALALLPRTCITIVVQILHDGGSLQAAMLNCVSLALVDAGIPLTALVAAVEARLVADDGAAVTGAAAPTQDDAADVGRATLHLDPSSKEEAAAGSAGSVLHACAWRGDSPSTVLVRAHGPQSAEALGGHMRMTTAACATVAAFQRLAIVSNVDAAAVNFDGDPALLLTAPECSAEVATAAVP